jgi:hypothetical protein
MHAVSTTERAPEAATLFRRLGLAGICDAP